MPIHERRNSSNLKLAVIILAVCAGVWLIAWAGGRSVELRKRLICTSNIKNVGTTLKIYSVADQGSLDTYIEWAVASGLIDPSSTICPSSGLSKCNYVWIPPLDTASIESNAVIMYEPKSNHRGEGGNILFADGHAEFVRGAEYDRLIESTAVR